MIKADIYYRENLKRILKENNIDKNPRPKYKDGTDAHCLFITQIFEEYDISKGEFPITTLRNTAIKTGIKELLVIYQKQLNTRLGFEENDVNWWEPWMNIQGNIGRAYSYNLESHRKDEMKKTVVKITPRIVDESFSLPINIPKNIILGSIDDRIYKSTYRDYGDYIIIDECNKDGRKYVKCQFLNTGYITEIRYDSIKNKKQHPKNNLIRTNLGIGYLDNVNDLNFTKNEIRIMKGIWSRMIRRCNDNRKEYENIFVHNRWHSFRNFINDIRYIPQYHLAKEDDFKNWELDKDYYASNCYSSETCVFLSKKENLIYRKNIQVKPIKIIENDNEYFELTYTSLGEKLCLSKGYVKLCVEKGFYKNLKFERIDDDKFVYRYELSRNQINSILKSLKTDKYSRRHIVSFWNWANIDKKELVECAYETMWSVRDVDGIMYLDMTLNQRSSDFLVANFINKTQYLALMMMVASHLEYKVGKFCHFVQNLHIYDRHINAAYEILDKVPLNIQPTIELKNNKSFYDFTLNDFIIKNIEGITKIESSLELGI
jgi:thymidylate synthase